MFNSLWWLPLQARFTHDERVYKAFLEILNMYRKGRKSITDVYEEVRSAFMHEYQTTSAPPHDFHWRCLTAT